MSRVQFSYPHPAMVSPHAPHLESLVSHWLTKYDCLTPDFKEKLKKGRFGDLAARFFPLASLPQLIFMTRWNLAFFAFDDSYGPLPLAQLSAHCNRAVQILQGAQPGSADSEIFRQIATMRDEIAPFVTTHRFWMDQFIGSMQLFFEGMQRDTQFSYKEDVTYPSLEEYLVLREKIVATYPLLDFAELEADAILPPEVITHPVISRVRQLACRLVSWSNDVYSLHKELEDREAMNLVLVIETELHCSREEAINRAVNIHNTDLAEFIQLTGQLPDFGSHSDAVGRYINAVGLLLSGHIAWYDHTFRY